MVGEPGNLRGTGPPKPLGCCANSQLVRKVVKIYGRCTWRRFVLRALALSLPMIRALHSLLSPTGILPASYGTHTLCHIQYS